MTIFGIENASLKVDNPPDTNVSNNFTYEIWWTPYNSVSSGGAVSANTQQQSTSGYNPKWNVIEPSNISKDIENWQTSSDVGIGLNEKSVNVNEYREDRSNIVYHAPLLLTANAELSSQSFSQVVITFEDKKPTLYVNGNLVATGLKSESHTVYATTKKIKSIHSTLGRVRLYKKTLANTKIYDLYKNTKNHFEGYSPLSNSVFDIEIPNLDFKVNTSFVKGGTVLNWYNSGTVPNSAFVGSLGYGNTIVYNDEYVSFTNGIANIALSFSSTFTGGLNKTIKIELVDPISGNIVSNSNTITITTDGTIGVSPGFYNSACGIMPTYIPSFEDGWSLSELGPSTNGISIIQNKYIRYGLNQHGSGALVGGSTYWLDAYNNPSLYNLGLRFDPTGQYQFQYYNDDYITGQYNSWESYAFIVNNTTILLGTSGSVVFSPFTANTWNISSKHVVSKIGDPETTGIGICQYKTFGNEPVIRMKMTYTNTTDSPVDLKILRGINPKIGYNQTNNSLGLASISSNDIVIANGIFNIGKPLSLFVPWNGIPHRVGIQDTPTNSSQYAALANSVLNGVGNVIDIQDKSLIAAWDCKTINPGNTVSVCAYYILSKDDTEILSLIEEDYSPSPTFTITPNLLNVNLTNESETIIYTITTTNIPNGTTLHWKNSGTTTANDFVDNINQGTIVINSGSATLTRVLSNEPPIEGSETIIIELIENVSTGQIVATAPTVFIDDSPVYEINPNVSSVSEGSTVEFFISTINVPDGTILYWTNSGTTTANDFIDNINEGSITINSGTANITRTVIDDLLNENQENIKINLRKNSNTGVIVANSSTVVIPGTFCDPYQAEEFPFLTYFPYDADGNYYNQYFYDDPAANGVSLNINLGGFSSSWENDGTGQPWERVITSFFDPYGTLYVDGGIIYDYPPDPLYLSMGETYGFQIDNNKSLYVAVGGDSDGYVTAPVGHSTYPGVATLNTFDSYLQPRNYGEPIIFELWFSLNPDRTDLTKGYGNYTFFGEGSYVLPDIWIDYNTDPYGSTRKIKKYQGGILKVDADMNNLQDSDFVYGVSFVDTGSSGDMKLIINGTVVNSYSLNSTNRMSGYVDCSFYDELTLMGNNKSYGNYIEIGSSGNQYIWWDAYDNGGSSNTANYFDTYLVKWAWIVDAESSGDPLDDQFYCDHAHPQMYTLPNVDLSCDPGAFPTYTPPAPLPGLPEPPADPSCDDGLVLHLDAANTSSYSGSGTNWNDLSCLGYTGELMGSPTFDNVDGGGCFVFNPSNSDFVKVTLPADRTIKSFTYNVWIMRTAGGPSWSSKTIIDCGDDNIFFGLDSNDKLFMYNPYYETNYTLSYDTWYNIVVTHAHLEPIRFYVNGSLIHTTSNNNTVVKASYFNIGAGYSPSSANEFFSGKIAVAQIYNKKLTPTEVTNYFNATKSRFGL